jgi:hypothetical protein
MALAVSTQELDDFARLLTQAGVTSVETNWRGFTCQFTEGMEAPAADALKVLRERIERIEGKDARRMFIERLTDATKELVRQQKQRDEAVAAVRH